MSEYNIPNNQPVFKSFLIQFIVFTFNGVILALSFSCLYLRSPVQKSQLQVRIEQKIQKSTEI